MAAQKKAAAKKAPAKKAASPSSTSTRAPAGAKSVARRVDELEGQVAKLSGQVENLAKFVATIVSAQLQQQLLASPDPEAHIAAFASANGITL